MIARSLCIAATALLAPPAFAQEIATPPPGLWHVPGSACPVTFEIANADHVVRTTGKLRYTTKVVFTPANHGWTLAERLESDNGEKSCRGESIADVKEHLRRDAHIRILGDSLFYEGGPYLEMKRGPVPARVGT